MNKTEAYRPPCPKCRSPLSFIVDKERSTKEINISIECEWCDDFYGFTMRTGIKPRDIGRIAKSKEPIKLQVEIVPNPEPEYIASEEERPEEIEEELERPTTGKGADREDWIKYLAKAKVIPLWDDRWHPFSVFFRRLQKQEGEGRHLTGFGKKTRRRVAEILGIKTEDDCDRVRAEIIQRFEE